MKKALQRTVFAIAFENETKDKIIIINWGLSYKYHDQLGYAMQL